MPILAYAVNMTVNASTGFTPFEMDTGYNSNSPIDMLFARKPMELDIDTFEKSAKEHLVHVQRVKELYVMASAIANDAREVVMNRLNSSTGVKPKFEVNEKVGVYVPGVPSKDSAWKQKHLLHWRFATVIERVSHTTYIVKDRRGRTFQRSIARS